MSEKDKPTVLLEYCLKKLRLPTMLREYATMTAVCQKDRTDFPTYLLSLVEREFLDRENRAAERRVKVANFPGLKTIDTFDFKARIFPLLYRRQLTPRNFHVIIFIRLRLNENLSKGW